MSHNSEWWSHLGLSFDDETAVKLIDRRANEAALDVVAGYRPVAFERVEDGGEPERITLNQLATRVRAAKKKVRTDFNDSAQARRDLGWAAIRAAQESPDANDVITDGLWVGFTRAQAIAWSWNLAQYKPFQFAGVFNVQRIQRERALEEGVVPEVAHYAEMAREHEAKGISAEDYRRAHDILDNAPFSMDQVESNFRSVR